MRKTFFALMIVTTVACSQKKAENGDSDRFAKGEKLVEVEDKKMQELSGIAASANNPGMLWTINDSGNSNEVLLVDQKLKIKLICKLKGITNRDWEDITVGPGPEEGKNYVYVGDIGDNMALFQYKYVYRFEEPTPGKDESIEITNFDRITFQLPDKKKDTESLMIDPKTKNLYTISKRENPVHVYEIPYPYSTKDTVTARSIAAIPFTQIVAADFSPDGKELLMKNYENVYYWVIGNNDLKQVLNEKPFILNYTQEPQGESITFARDGSGFFTISEIVKGEKSYLYFYKRK